MHADAHKSYYWQACPPDSIDTFISLIGPNFVEIWACACTKIAFMHGNMHPRLFVSAQTS